MRKFEKRAEGPGERFGGKRAGWRLVEKREAGKGLIARKRIRSESQQQRQKQREKCKLARSFGESTERKILHERFSSGCAEIE